VGRAGQAHPRSQTEAVPAADRRGRRRTGRQGRAGLVRSLAQQRGDHDEEHDQEWNRLAGELLARHADRFPALAKAVAEGAFEAGGVDPLAFGLDRILDGVEALIAGRD
jgi:Tetracyclin repressor-like, C-terminal domain